MRQLLKLVVHFPARLWALLLVLSAALTFARVLLAHDMALHAMDAASRWPQRAVYSSTHSVFLPLGGFAIGAAVCVASAWLGGAAERAELALILAPMLLLLCRRWVRVAALPVYAFAVAVQKSTDTFYGRVVSQSYVGRTLSAALWEFLAPEQNGPSWLARWLPHWPLAYGRLVMELVVAAVTCGVYAIALYCREPLHDGDELREAARNNDTARIKLLLARGVKPDEQSADGSTALHVCAQQALVTGARLLLEHGADPNARDCLGFAPLHWAVQLRREEPSPSSRLDAIRMLLRHGADPKQPAACGTTPLAIASRKENEAAHEAMKEIVDLGPDNDAVNEIDRPDDNNY